MNMDDDKGGASGANEKERGMVGRNNAQATQQQVTSKFPEIHELKFEHELKVDRWWTGNKVCSRPICKISVAQPKSVDERGLKVNASGKERRN